ncbi:sodium-dependent lysophosphatidylcholine symporter 1 [Xyrichtys novacula]|uniref:Sodium-dependent lysophosphatidylcholine symporter 1 n=1 Tax=Xyrichtys novacula TaxID=13765 RepID=A0AAV1HGD6_XYRNO|nr:sodium-dependent lysophosphatidylcholine symporter 1 [Xyrichtys novacula]
MSCTETFTEKVQRLKSQLLKKHAGSDSSQRGSGGIPLATKLCYAAGGVPYQVTTVAIGVSLQIFLLDVVPMEPYYASMILFVSRAWDAVTDPLVGYLVSRSEWTPIGKLIPWLVGWLVCLSCIYPSSRCFIKLSQCLSDRLVLSTPFAVFSYLLLWFVPRGFTSQALSVLWFLVAACLFETLISCYNVPFLALNMFLGGDHRDRDSATAYRMSVEMLAMLLASVIQGQVVTVYNTEKQKACEHPDEIPQSTSSPQTASLKETEKAFLTSALIMGALFYLSSLVLFLGVKEQRAPACSDDQARPPYLTSLKLLIHHVPYQRLVLGFMFCALAFQMSLGNFALFCSHAAGLGAQFQHLLLALLASASIAVPLWQMVLLRIGKKVTTFIGLSLFIPAVTIVACVPSNLPVFMIMCILMGFSVGTIFLLPWSMLPDVVDDFAEKHPSCRDLEPLFFSCYAFCSKLAGGLAAGISTMTLQFVGYKASACHHGEEVVTALIVLFSPVAIILLLIGMVFFWFYPIKERQRLQPQEQPSTAQPDAALSSSGSREISEQPASLQQQSDPSQCSFSHNKKCSVKSSVCSNVSKSPSTEFSGPTAVVQSNENPQCQEQRLSRTQHSGGEKLVRNSLKIHYSGSNVRSKVTWV